MKSDIRLSVTPEEIEMMIQEVDGIKWPCVCGKPRIQERDLLCGECWEKIPAEKRRGVRFLDRDSEEYHKACEQILRIANKNLTEQGGQDE